MKLNCGKTWPEQYAMINEGIHPRQQWREWFAWHVTRVGPEECVWFETVMRRDHYYSGWGESGWNKECITIELYKAPVELYNENKARMDGE